MSSFKSHSNTHYTAQHKLKYLKEGKKSKLPYINYDSYKKLLTSLNDGKEYCFGDIDIELEYFVVLVLIGC